MPPRIFFQYANYVGMTPAEDGDMVESPLSSPGCQGICYGTWSGSLPRPDPFATFAASLSH
ncbi:hypothetical protein LTR94_004106 [Friedmanniomyces endolithicus]|nr:hypothetical protein LTR94_004106 [Friedmanniomyces endolithicus]